MITQPKTKTKFATVQDYLDCDNRFKTSNWIKPLGIWSNPEFKAKMLAKHNTPERKKKQSEAIKKHWSNPEFKAKMVARHNTPERKKKVSEKLLKMWSDPKYKAKRLAKVNTPELKKKKSKALKKCWSDPEYKAKMLALRSTPEYKKMVRDKRYGVNYVTKTKPRVAK
jgi:hypothetical protein